MADVAEPDREASNTAAVGSLEPPNDENGGENNKATKQSEAPIVDTAQSPAKNHSPEEEKANDADGDTVMEGTNEEGTHQPSNGTPSSKKSSKRKSSSAIPEHKTKKLNRKKSTKDLQLHLDVEPGQYWFARMKGYPPWPCIICDEEMLPETLLKTRPVSAKRLDGSYREDFTEGGKNARDRTYPVMFLGTNEFAWQVNTALEPLDVEKIKEETPEKKTKAHWEAYKVAMEENDLQHFKDMLAEHESALKQDRKEKAEREAKKNSKKDNSRRKSKDKAAEEEEEDYDMDDDEGEGGQKTKGNKKRKKDPESDGEPLKPTKTPKTKLKVNGPKPLQEEPSSKKKEKSAKSRASTSKAKGADDEDNDEAQAGDKPLTESEIQEKRKKTVLYLRHKLQKGFLSRDQAPIEAEMTAMSGHFESLEQYANLEAPIIRVTKINKVLKGIVKLNSIPKDEEFNFKKRSTELLSQWNKVLNAEEGPSAGGDTMNTNEKRDSTVNGVTHEKASEDQKTKDEEKDEQKDIEMKDGHEDKNDAETNDHGKEDAAKVDKANGDDSVDVKETEKPVDEEKDQDEEADTEKVPSAAAAAVASEKEGETVEEKKETAEAAKAAEAAKTTTATTTEEKETEMET